MLKTARSILVLLLLVGVGFFAVPTAQAIQTSGSISLIPSAYFELAENQIIDVIVRVNNTSSNTPDPTPPIEDTAPQPATLTGTIVVTLACDDNDGNTLACASCTERQGALMFVPVGANGCVSSAAGVASCAVQGGDANKVDITMTPGGVALSAGASVDVATIRVKVLVKANTLAKTFMHAETEGLDIKACSSVRPALCVSCSADGCTVLTYPGGANVCPKRLHQFPGIIHVLQGLDDFELHLAIPAPFAVSAGDAVTVQLANGGGTLFTATTLSPHLLSNGAPKLRYFDGSVATNGTAGIRLINTTVRANGDLIVDLIAYEDLSALGSPAGLTLTLTMGANSPLTIGPQDWVINPNQGDEFDLILQPCPTP